MSQVATILKHSTTLLYTLDIKTFSVHKTLKTDCVLFIRSINVYAFYHLCGTEEIYITKFYVYTYGVPPQNVYTL